MSEVLHDPEVAKVGGISGIVAMTFVYGYLFQYFLDDKVFGEIEQMK